MLLLVDRQDAVVGEIEYFPISSYLRGYELSYHLFDREQAGRATRLRHLACSSPTCSKRDQSSARN